MPLCLLTFPLMSSIATKKNVERIRLITPPLERLTKTEVPIRMAEKARRTSDTGALLLE